MNKITIAILVLICVLFLSSTYFFIHQQKLKAKENELPMTELTKEEKEIQVKFQAMDDLKKYISSLPLSSRDIERINQKIEFECRMIEISLITDLGNIHMKRIKK